MWNKLPIWFRAVVVGLLVSAVPTFVWAALAGVNLRFTPRVPWAAPLMAVLLWIYWRYLRRDREALRAEPLERAYGPVVAIAVTSVLFTLIHLSHGAAILVFLPFYFVVAVVYGVLAFVTGSILPSITLHVAGDLLTFTLRYLHAFSS